MHVAYSKAHAHRFSIHEASLDPARSGASGKKVHLGPYGQGALLVLPFAALEILAVGVCFLIFSRHVLDQERIVVDGSQVVVEHEAAGVRERAQFQREWVRIEPLGGEHSLIAVSGQGKTMQVGRYVRPERREALAHELRRAVRMG